MRKEALGIFWGLQRRTTSGFHGIFFLGDGAWKIRSECEEQDLMLLEVTRNFLVLPTSSSKGLPTFRSISDTIGWKNSNGWLILKHCGYFRFLSLENFTSHLSRPNSITYNATIAACARAAAWRQALTLLARRSAAEISIVSYHKVISCGFLPQLSHDLEEKKREEIVDMAWASSS